MKSKMYEVAMFLTLLIILAIRYGYEKKNVDRKTYLDLFAR